MKAIVLGAVLCLVGGCAHYEFNLTDPPDLSRHIGSSTDQVIGLDPLEYRMRSVEGRLVVRVYNQSDDAIELLGEKSFVVDPEGQSRRLHGQTIAPHAFLKLILPPMRPRVYNTGPTFGVGVGVGVDRRFHHDHHRSEYRPPNLLPDARPNEPRYLDVYVENDQQFWDWSGAGSDVRLMLVFRRGEKTFQHGFTFKRVKV